MLGTQRRPVTAQCGPTTAQNTAVRGNPDSRRYGPVAAATATAKEPQARGLSLLQWVGRAVNSWLWHRQQRRALGKLDKHMLRDIGLSTGGLSPEEEKQACAVPFRLPRQ